MVLLIFSAPLSFGQSNVQYLKKADDFIKDFLSDLNNIYDSTLATPEYKRTVSNRILNDIMESRDSTILYDNLSMQVIKNNRLNAQKYMDNYLFILQARLDEWSTRYVVRNTMAEFKEDTVYLDHTGQHVICKLSRIIRVDFANEFEKRKHRTDTISFYVKFVNKDLYERRIISSDRYISRQAELKEILDTDGDGIPNEKDKCLLIPGVEYCDGCPDSDSDGVCDKMDECPSEKGVDLCKGCPDSDSDGVCDKEDKCPAQKGPPANFGCPVSAKPVLKGSEELPIFTIPIGIDVKDLLDSKKSIHELDLNCKYISNLNPSKFRNLKGSEIFRISLNIKDNKLNKKYYIESKLLEIHFESGKVISLDPVIYKTECSYHQTNILSFFKIDLSDQEQLANYLKLH